MDCIIKQSKLLELPNQAANVQEPKYLINWEQTRPELKKYLYLHLIQGVMNYKNTNSKLNKQKLVEKISKNMGNILKEQLYIYIENLNFFGYISESHNDGSITLTDKLYRDLQKVDKIINERRIEEAKQTKNEDDVK